MFDGDMDDTTFEEYVDYLHDSIELLCTEYGRLGVFLDVHCSMKQPHDTQIGRQVLTRNLNQVTTITADKGYDWDDLRQTLREHDIRPVIKHKEFWPLDKAHNARMNDAVYHQRSNIEAAFFALKHRYGDRLRARTWFGQFRELVLKSAVRNIELAVRR